MDSAYHNQTPVILLTQLTLINQQNLYSFEIKSLANEFTKLKNRNSSSSTVKRSTLEIFSRLFP